MPGIWIDDERIGQYRYRRRAQDHARSLRHATGLPHRIMLTTTYRDLIPLVCWTVVLGRPGPGDRFQG